MEELTRFEVTGHYYLEQRGGFVIGQIKGGEFQIGMLVPVGGEDFLTISGIEYVDNIKERKFANALMFSEQPSIEYVKKHFPVGAVLHAHA